MGAMVSGAGSKKPYFESNHFSGVDQSLALNDWYPPGLHD
jgi:hypothetical protein